MPSNGEAVFEEFTQLASLLGLDHAEQRAIRSVIMGSGSRVQAVSNAGQGRRLSYAVQMMRRMAAGRALLCPLAETARRAA